MFALRRAALRIAQQPTRQLSTIRPAARASPLHPLTISSVRSFHQTLRWAAEEENKPAEEAESTRENVTTEPSAAEQAEIKEESIVTPKVADMSDIFAAGKNQAESAVATAQDVVFNAARSIERGMTGDSLRPGGLPGRAGMPEPSPCKVLYVGNLFFEVTISDLAAEFGRFGEVVNTRIVTDARGMSKGFGYVEFSSQHEADAAVKELDQRTFQGRRMAVQYHVRREPKAGRSSQDRPDWNDRPPMEPSKTLFVGNMSYQMSDRDLNDLFREIRNVLDVRVAIDRRTGQPRGFAHADFVDIESAQKAKELLQTKVVYGRQLRVDFSAGTTASKSPDAEE